MPDEPLSTDWAYAAGFVDGEGCIAIVRSFVPLRGRPRVDARHLGRLGRRRKLRARTREGQLVMEVPNRHICSAVSYGNTALASNQGSSMR